MKIAIAILLCALCGCATTSELEGARRESNATNKLIDAKDAAQNKRFEEMSRRLDAVEKNNATVNVDWGITSGLVTRVGTIEQDARDEKIARDTLSKEHETQVRNIERWVGIGATAVTLCLGYLTFTRERKREKPKPKPDDEPEPRQVVRPLRPNE
jgi:hypothetical protein